MVKQKMHRGRAPRLLLVLVFLGLVVAGGVWQFSRNQTDRTSRISSSEQASAQKPNFDQLLGRWLRPDGGYIIEIRKVDSTGKMEAAYFNPRPINVSRAAASRKEGKTQIFIELRDQGYPGSTYSLTHDSKRDVLTGQYFQAAIGQVFEVAFVRTN